MKTEMKHLGYSGSAELSIEDGCLHGRILFINDLITYEGETVPELKIAFEAAVDDYLAYCKETGKAPNKPYSGTFNVRTGPERHRSIAIYAARFDISINDAVCRAVDMLVDIKNQQPVVINNHYNQNHYYREGVTTTKVTVPFIAEDQQWTH